MSSHSHEHAHNHSHDHGDGHNHGHGQEEEGDYLHVLKVLAAFAFYKRHALNHNYRRRRDFHSLPEHHKRLVPELLSKIDQVDKCIEENTKFLGAIIQGSGQFLGFPVSEIVKQVNQKPDVSPMDMDKVKSTFKQFVRDWSKEASRDMVYIAFN